MKILRKNEFQKLIELYPDGGIVFAEGYDGCNQVEVTLGEFGARELVPYSAEVFDYDFNINEYPDNSIFHVFEHDDILLMIKTLTSGLKLNLQVGFGLNDNR